MAKSNLLAGIDLDGLDIPATVEKVHRVIEKEAPAIKKGMRQVEADVLKTGKALYDWLADESGS